MTLNIENLLPAVGAALASLLGALIFREWAVLKSRKLEGKTYAQRLSGLTGSLLQASREVDKLLGELADVAQHRAESVQQVENTLRELDTREKQLKGRIQALELTLTGLLMGGGAPERRGAPSSLPLGAWFYKWMPYLVPGCCAAAAIGLIQSNADAAKPSQGPVVILMWLVTLLLVLGLFFAGTAFFVVVRASLVPKALHSFYAHDEPASQNDGACQGSENDVASEINANDSSNGGDADRGGRDNV